jgi:Sulfotransferase family
MENSNKVKVLYIAGTGRCGSTLLGNTLGQVEGFTHVGELFELFWAKLSHEGSPCGCGAPISACETWEAVLKEAYGDTTKSLDARMLQFRRDGIAKLNFLRGPNSRATRTLRQSLGETLEDLERLYRAIQKVFNCDVIVDSSKASFYLYSLQLIDAIDLYVLHLVRDPRAWAYAFLHKIVRGGSVLYSKPLRSSFEWSIRNCAFEAMSGGFRHRPLRLRYEDFVANPRSCLQSILNFVDEIPSSLPLEDEHSVNLDVQHTVWGNPNRFKRGTIEIREDDSWKTKMKNHHRILVTAATWPLMVKYGYLHSTPATHVLGE